MYFDNKSGQPDLIEAAPRRSAIGRFERWLRSHGYEPEQDPFCPAEICFEETESAAKLVDEFLADRPREQVHRNALMEHALQIGEVAAAWGHNGCGLANIFRDLDASDVGGREARDIPEVVR